jgi:transposase
VTILRDYVRRIRPTKRPVYLKLHFAPGECAQADWGAYGTVAVGNTRRRLSFFVMVLAFSRQRCEVHRRARGRRQAGEPSARNRRRLTDQAVTKNRR